MASRTNLSPAAVLAITRERPIIHGGYVSKLASGVDADLAAELRLPFLLVWIPHFEIRLAGLLTIGGTRECRTWPAVATITKFGQVLLRYLVAFKKLLRSTQRWHACARKGQCVLDEGARVKRRQRVLRRRQNSASAR